MDIETRTLFLENPNEPTGGPAAAPAAAPAATPTTTPAASVPTTTSTATATPQTGTATAPANSQAAAGSPASTTSTPGATVAPAAPSWLDNLRTDGFTTTETDEAKIRKQLVQSYQDAERLKPLAPVLSQYQQHAADFQKYLAERQAAAQKQAVQQDWTAEFYQHPEYNPAWRFQVTQDANGNLVPAQGVDPGVVAKYQAAQAFRQETVEKFLTNPFKFMEPAIRKIAQEISGQQAQQGVGQYQEQQEAKAFVDQNASWLFEQDQGGRKVTQVFNPQTGRYDEKPVLSQWGQMFAGALQTAQANGLSPKNQQDYALKTVQNAYMSSPAYAQYLLEKQKAAPPAAPAAPAAAPQTARQAANAAFTQAANPAGVPAPTGGNAVPSEPKVTKQNLEQIMLRRFQEAGVTL